MTLENTANQIVLELTTAQNLDLAQAVMRFEEGQSFMDFADPFSQLSFDEFAGVQRVMDMQLNPALSELVGEDAPPPVVDMSKAYDRYLDNLAQKQAASPLNKAQAVRWEAIIARYSAGWTGGVYEVMCRDIQQRLNQVLASDGSAD